MEKEISTHVIPYKDFPKGWSVILYDDTHHEFEEVVNSLTGLNVSEETAAAITHYAHTHGYAVLHNSDDKFFSEMLVKHLRFQNFQVELFFQG